MLQVPVVHEKLQMKVACISCQAASHVIQLSIVVLCGTAAVNTHTACTECFLG